ncbi:MAG TPA: glycosyltransferase family 87 protein [Hyphomonas sp.]|nr:hypothetical protein [Hyphomonas sp.]HRJ01873.1 glycosyltransferase family 87 protein [Hyphomonas sp.]HRK68738.1 glycosyltransferase family 87 protein [Hyphomonas sp.]
MDAQGLQPAWTRAPRLLACAALLCLANAAVWAPQIAAVLHGLFSGDVLAGFANRDFANYWLSGRLALSGDLSPLYRQETHQAALEAAFGLGALETRNWSYPPHFVLFTWPLGLMPYAPAYALFMLASGGWFLMAMRSALRAFGGDAGSDAFGLVVLLLAPFICLQVLAGQNGFFFGAAMLQALAWRGSRPVAAAAMIALLTMKPQLGLLIPLLLLAERRWAVIGWTIAMSAALTGVSAIVFGPDAWRAFFTETLPYQRFVAAHWDGMFLYMMPTWFASLRAAGVGHETALFAHGVVVLPLVAACLAAMWTAKDEAVRSRLLLAGTFVATPYAFNYDLGALLALAAIWIAAQKTDSWTRAIGGSLILALPLWTPLVGRPDVMLVLPALAMTGLLAVWAAPVLAPHLRPLAIRAGFVR